MVEVMAASAIDRFPVAGHDRGARVGYRLALDASRPASSGSRCSTSCRPTTCGTGWTAISRLKLYHWPFLAQPAPMPETADRQGPASFRLDARLGTQAKARRFEGARSRLPRRLRRAGRVHADLQRLSRRADLRSCRRRRTAPPGDDRCPLWRSGARRAPRKRQFAGDLAELGERRRAACHRMPVISWPRRIRRDGGGVEIPGMLRRPGVHHDRDFDRQATSPAQPMSPRIGSTPRAGAYLRRLAGFAGRSRSVSSRVASRTRPI